MKRTNLIRECGLDRKVASLIIAGGVTDPANVAKTLNADPEAQVALAGRKVLVADVIAFKESLEAQSGASVAALVKKDDDSARLVALVHEKITSIAEMANDVEVVTKSLYARIRDWLADESWSPSKEEVATFNAAAKQMELVLKVVDTLKADKVVQTYIAKGTFVNQQGYTLDQVFDFVCDTARELGHTREEAMSAFAKARTKAKAEQVYYDLPS